MNETETSVEVNLDIKPYNIDAAGHVNNAVYMNWLEDLRIKLFEEYFNFQELLEKKLYPVVISTEIVYKRILRLFDKPTGIMYLEYCKHGMIMLKAEIRLNGKIAASGKQKCVLLDLNNSSIIKAQKLQEIFKHNINN